MILPTCISQFSYVLLLSTMRKLENDDSSEGKGVLHLITHSVRNDLRETGDTAPGFPAPGHYRNVQNG